MSLLVRALATTTMGDLPAIIKIPLIGDISRYIFVMRYLQAIYLSSVHVYAPLFHRRGLPVLGELVIIEWKYSAGL